MATLTFTQTGAYRMFNALQAIVLTPALRAHLEANDPQALRQALEALAGAAKPGDVVAAWEQA